MAIATYRGEKNVAELATRLYTRLAPRQREKAEAALLAANPHLHDLRRLEVGAILRVPRLDKLRLRKSRDLEPPETAVTDSVAAALKRYSERLDTRFRTDEEATKTAITLLKSAVFKRALDDQPELQQSAKLAAQALAVRAKALDTRQTAFKAAVKEGLANLEKGPR